MQCEGMWGVCVCVCVNVYLNSFLSQNQMKVSQFIRVDHKSSSKLLIYKWLNSNTHCAQDCWTHPPLLLSSPRVSQWWYKENVKFSLSTPGRYMGGGEVQLHSFNFGTRWRQFIHFTHWPLYTTGKEPWYPLNIRFSRICGWRREKSTAPIRIPTMNHAARSLVTLLITQSWLPVVEKGYVCLVIVCWENKKILCFKMYHHLQCNNDEKDGTRRQHCCIFLKKCLNATPNWSFLSESPQFEEAMVGGKMHAWTWEHQFAVFKYWQVSRNVSVTWTTFLNHLIGFKEVTPVYCENHTEHTSTICRKKYGYF